MKRYQDYFTAYCDADVEAFKIVTDGPQFDENSIFENQRTKEQILILSMEANFIDNCRRGYNGTERIHIRKGDRFNPLHPV